MTRRPLLRASGALALVPLVLAAGAAAAPPAGVVPDARYSGVTSQGNECLEGSDTSAPCIVRVTTSPSGRRMVFEVRYRSSCSNDQTLRAGFETKPIPISPNGRFSYETKTRDELGGGAEVVSRAEFAGRFRDTKVKGRLAARSEIEFPSGPPATCDSPKIKFVARR